MDYFRLYGLRLKCCWDFLGSPDFCGDPISLGFAWFIACTIYPLEDLPKWWLGTGWLGPGCDLYCRKIAWPPR